MYLAGLPYCCVIVFLPLIALFPPASLPPLLLLPLNEIQVCRKATYGYDQRVEFFGTTGLVKHDNHFPSAVQKWNGTSVAQADLPHAFFMTRYEDAYKNETRVS